MGYSSGQPPVRAPAAPSGRGSGSLDKAASAQASATATALRGRHFPNPVAVYSDSFVFTTLDNADLEKHKRAPFVHPHTKQACRLFTLDNEVEYRPFSKDYGPLNLAYTVHGVCTIQDIINDQPANARPLCLYTMPAPETKANIALLASLYYLLVKGLDPATALMPIAKLEVMPFRDAGNGVFDHALSIQDCLYGIEKAHKYGLLGLDNFDIKEYVFYEQVPNGDLNLLGPFIPFASPIEDAWRRAMQPRWEAIAQAEKTGEPLPPMRVLTKGRLAGNQAFRNVLDVFGKQNVGLVVRLNDELYDKRHFTDVGMEHVEMYFDDGTCPTDEIVRDFIDRAVEQIERGKKVAVHCKAGLGRTGVLIGAYFIYKYGFSAQEVIAFMRIVRPGMVVGPQQQYMLLNQMKWAQWAAKDELKREMGLSQSSQATTHLATPPADDMPLPPVPAKDYGPLSPPISAVRAAFGGADIDMDHYDMRYNTHSHAHATTQAAGRQQAQSQAAVSYHKHGDAVGQPRKAANANGKRYVEAPTSMPVPAAGSSPTRTGSASPSGKATALSPGRLPSPSPTPERAMSQADEGKSTAGASAGSQSQSASAGSAQSSMRGTKRGNRGARATVTAQQAVESAENPTSAPATASTRQEAAQGGSRAQHQAAPTTPRAELELPTRLPYLERSPSLASVTSENDRPRKKAHGSGWASLPLSPLRNAASAPASISGPAVTSPSGIPGADREGRSTRRHEQSPPISGLPAPRAHSATPSMGSTAAQSLSAATGAAAAPASATGSDGKSNGSSAPARRPPSRIPASLTPVSAPATTRRQASPLRESTADNDALNVLPNSASSIGSGGAGAGAGAGSRIPRMGMAPGSPLMRALKGYQSSGSTAGSEKGDKEEKKDKAARSKLVPRAVPHTQSYGHQNGSTGIPSPSAASASRRQGVMGAMGALSPPRLGAMWSGLGRSQG